MTVLATTWSTKSWNDRELATTWSTKSCNDWVLTRYRYFDDLWKTPKIEKKKIISRAGAYDSMTDENTDFTKRWLFSRLLFWSMLGVYTKAVRNRTYVPARSSEILGPQNLKWQKGKKRLWILVCLKHLFWKIKIRILFANPILDFLVVFIFWRNAYERLLNRFLRDPPWP